MVKLLWTYWTYAVFLHVELLWLLTLLCQEELQKAESERLRVAQWECCSVGEQRRVVAAPCVCVCVSYANLWNHRTIQTIRRMWGRSLSAAAAKHRDAAISSVQEINGFHFSIMSMVGPWSCFFCFWFPKFPGSSQTGFFPKFAGFFHVFHFFSYGTIVAQVPGDRFLVSGPLECLEPLGHLERRPSAVS